MRQTLKKREILRGYGAYKEVLSHGTLYSGKSLKIFVIYSQEKIDSEQQIKIGFTISRKIRSAVVRNKIKRLMREVVRKNKELLHQCCREAAISRLILMCIPLSICTAGRSHPGYNEMEIEFRMLMQRIPKRL